MKDKGEDLNRVRVQGEVEGVVLNESLHPLSMYVKKKCNDLYQFSFSCVYIAQVLTNGLYHLLTVLPCSNLWISMDKHNGHTSTYSSPI